MDNLLEVKTWQEGNLSCGSPRCEVWYVSTSRGHSSCAVRRPGRSRLRSLLCSSTRHAIPVHKNGNAQEDERAKSTQC